MKLSRIFAFLAVALTLGAAMPSHAGTVVPPVQGFRLKSTLNNCDTAGDSRLQQGSVLNATSYDISPLGVQYWTETLTNGAVHFPFAGQHGVAGSTTAYLLATEVPQVLADNPSCVVVFDGTNDPGTPYTATQTISNLQSALTQFSNAGINVYLISESCRGSTTFTSPALSGTQLAAYQTIRNWDLNFAPTIPRVKVINAAAIMCDATSTTNYYLNNATKDGLHQNTAFAYNLAAPLISAITTDFPPGITEFTSASDTYSPTTQLGNLLGDGRLTGSGGTVSGSITGTCPASWGCNLTSDNTLAAVLSQVTVNGVNCLQIVLSGTTNSSPAAPNFNIYRALSAGNLTNLVSGATIQGRMIWQLDPGSTGVVFIGDSISRTATSGNNSANFGYSTSQGNSGGVYPSVATTISGTAYTPPLTIDKTETAVAAQPRIVLLESTVISATIRFCGIKVYQTSQGSAW